MTNQQRCSIPALPLPKKPVGSITTTAMAISGSHCFAQTLNFSIHVAMLSNTNSQQKIYPVLSVLLQAIKRSLPQNVCNYYRQPINISHEA
jgi:hypothetical protein